MPSRIVYRSKRSRRTSSVVPGGYTKRVKKGAKSNAPVYAYQPPKVALRKLIHHASIVPTLRVNNASIVYPTALSSFCCLNAITQDTGVEFRTNNKVYMKDLQLVWGHGVTSPSSTTFYYSVSVVYDRESRGSSPLIGDIYDTAAYDSLQRFDTRDRFDIVYRKVVACCPEFCWNGASMYPQAGLSWTRNFSELIPVNRMTCYIDPAGVSSSVLKGTLWLITHGNLSSGASNPSVFFSSRLTFIDVE